MSRHFGSLAAGLVQCFGHTARGILHRLEAGIGCVSHGFGRLARGLLRRSGRMDAGKMGHVRRMGGRSGRVLDDLLQGVLSSPAVDQGFPGDVLPTMVRSEVVVVHGTAHALYACPCT